LWKWKTCHALSWKHTNSFTFDQFYSWHGWFCGSSQGEC
jgi:hypothetical protein